MQYILTKNKQEIIIGPINWNTIQLQSELQLLNVIYNLPETEPTEKIIINDELEIFPVNDIHIPTYNSLYEQLSGPETTFFEGYATQTYSITNLPIYIIKQNLKQLAAETRFNKELLGITVEIQNNQIFIDTSRDNRDKYLQTYISLEEGQTINWKFDSIWLELTKAELFYIINNISLYMQKIFDEELNQIIKINFIESIEELKAIQIN